MTYQKLSLKPGINKERSDYTNEGMWYDGDKVRFRQGLPEKIGGWVRTSVNTFLGVCRALYDWAALNGQVYAGVGTHLKYYVEKGGAYYDITPERATVALTDPFTTVLGSDEVTVVDGAGGFIDGDFVTFSGASAVGGVTPDGEYQISVSGTATNTYTITVDSAASANATGGGSVTAVYQINVGTSLDSPFTGWGAGSWGLGTWGNGDETSVTPMRLWSQSAFGEDLIINPRAGALYYWDTSAGTGTRAVELGTLVGASGTPTVANYVLVSFGSRFVFAFGANEIGSSTQDLMLVRWSDQESVVDWTPSVTNQAGDYRLSNGSEIVTAIQSRQEILVWTDASLYSFQYVGAPIVWSTELVGTNISIIGPNAVAYADGVAYWMGVDKFYRYDGRTQHLPCDLRRHVFNDFNTEEARQVFAGTVEAFNEIWWFYCSAGQQTVDLYVVYNHREDIWYHGTLGRTAWLDSGLRSVPLGATYNNNLVNHETGADDDETGTPAAISSYITSAQFDIDDGDRYSFISEVLPDMTFDGSTVDSPVATMTFIPRENSGAGLTTPASESGNDSGTITRTATAPVEAYTEKIDLRIRGRQVAMKISSSALGVVWQLGSPRIDIRPDGRR